jgi:hypothetical protein
MIRHCTMIISAALWATCATAAQPVGFNYQARLRDASGAPLTGLHTLYFALFQGGDANTSSSGAKTFAESDSESLTDGIVSHTVGTGFPISGTLDSAQFEFNGDIFLQVSVDNSANAVLPRTRLDPVPFAVKALDAPATLFGQFGGHATNGNYTSPGNGVFPTLRSEFENFTVPAGTTVTATQGWAFVAVQGTCTIAGAVTATGMGAEGGGGGFSGAGNTGMDATGLRVSSAALETCASGAGGAGGGANTFAGGAGGGAQGAGGAGVVGGVGGDGHATNRSLVMAAGVSSAAGSGKTLTGNFQSLLLNLGAGGGGGGDFTVGVPGSGGAGGGVIYIECNELVFTGKITADGQPGGTSMGNGAGGGGGGGVILVRAHKITTNTGTVSAAGGTGGLQDDVSPSGGKGRDGFWDIVEIH